MPVDDAGEPSLEQRVHRIEVRLGIVAPDYPLEAVICAADWAWLEPFTSEWEITARPGGVWQAVSRSGDGRHIRVLTGHSAEELARKLADDGVVYDGPPQEG